MKMLISNFVCPSNYIFSGPQGEKGEPGSIGPPGSTAVVKADGETLLVLVSV